jgi:hypothetical protein
MTDRAASLEFLRGVVSYVQLYNLVEGCDGQRVDPHHAWSALSDGARLIENGTGWTVLVSERKWFRLWID